VIPLVVDNNFSLVVYIKYAAGNMSGVCGANIEQTILFFLLKKPGIIMYHGCFLQEDCLLGVLLFRGERQIFGGNKNRLSPLRRFSFNERQFLFRGRLSLLYYFSHVKSSLGGETIYV
jgi:hypothetical protein